MLYWALNTLAAYASEPSVFTHSLLFFTAHIISYSEWLITSCHEVPKLPDSEIEEHHNRLP